MRVGSRLKGCQRSKGARTRRRSPGAAQQMPPIAPSCLSQEALLRMAESYGAQPVLLALSDNASDGAWAFWRRQGLRPGQKADAHRQRMVRARLLTPHRGRHPPSHASRRRPQARLLRLASHPSARDDAGGPARRGDHCNGSRHPGEPRLCDNGPQRPEHAELLLHSGNQA